MADRDRQRAPGFEAGTFDLSLYGRGPAVKPTTRLKQPTCRLLPVTPGQAFRALTEQLLKSLSSFCVIINHRVKLQAFHSRTPGVLTLCQGTCATPRPQCPFS